MVGTPSGDVVHSQHQQGRVLLRVLRPFYAEHWQYLTLMQSWVNVINVADGRGKEDIFSLGESK